MIYRDNITIDISDLYKYDNVLDYSSIARFEDMICDYVNCKYAVALNGGTSGLLLGMLALGLKANDEIILPAYSYPAAYNCAKFLNLNIKICDVNCNTMCLDLIKLNDIITDNTKAIVFIEHLGYLNENILKIKNICNNRNIKLIEDSAQSLSHKYNNVFAGNFGDFGIYSFSGSKLLRCGEGGCLVTNSKSIYDYVITNRDGKIGNYNMSAILSKILIQQLQNIDLIIENRNKIQNIYSKYLNICKSNILKSLHSTAYLSNNADNIHEFLKINNIETRYKYYPSLLDSGDSNMIYNNYIELPQTYDLTEQQIQHICELVIKAENTNISNNKLKKLSGIMSSIKNNVKIL